MVVIYTKETGVAGVSCKRHSVTGQGKAPEWQKVAAVDLSLGKRGSGAFAADMRCTLEHRHSVQC